MGGPAARPADAGAVQPGLHLLDVRSVAKVAAVVASAARAVAVAGAGVTRGGRGGDGLPCTPQTLSGLTAPRNSPRRLRSPVVGASFAPGGGRCAVTR